MSNAVPIKQTFRLMTQPFRVKTIREIHLVGIDVAESSQLQGEIILIYRGSGPCGEQLPSISRGKSLFLRLEFPFGFERVPRSARPLHGLQRPPGASVMLSLKN